MQQQQRQQRSAEPQRREGGQQQRNGGNPAPGGRLVSSLWELARRPASSARQQLGLSLQWPAAPNEEERLLGTLSSIEEQQRREAAWDLRRWDERWELRTKPVAELRALAQQRNIAGRSRMRKQELVAALEAELGYVRQRPPAE